MNKDNLTSSSKESGLQSTNNMLDYRRCYRFLADEQIVLSYQGLLDGDLIDMLIQITERKLTKTKTKTRVKKKLINILVECLQNSLHYASRHEEDDLLSSSNFLILTKSSENKYKLFTGNYVTNEKASDLERRLEDIVNLSPEKLQEYYLEALNKDELPQEGGAGLGLVDIMRRSKNQMQYGLEKVNGQDKYTLFGLQIEIT